VKRRDFVTLLGGAVAAWPVMARAQQTTMPVVGYLRSGSRAASSQVEAGFRQGLSSIGFIEGRNVAIDYQYAENQNDRLMALTADLVRQPVAVIYAGDNITAVMVKAATTTIPVVFRIGGDPIQLGLVTSLSRPDGNMTGVSFLRHGHGGNQTANDARSGTQRRGHRSARESGQSKCRAGHARGAERSA